MRAVSMICAVSLLTAFIISVALASGTLCNGNIGWWLAVACASNAFAGLASLSADRLYPLAMALPVDLLFYMWVELDAPRAMDPFLFYGCMLAVFAAGAVAHFLRFGRNGGRILLLMFSDVALNGFFCGLDTGLIRI